MGSWRRLLAVGAAIAVLGGITTGVASAQEGQVYRPANAEVVAGQYIVLLKQAVAEKGALAGKYGGQIKRTFASALTGFTVTATEAQAKRLATDPRVARVEADSLVRATGTQTNPPWDLDRVDQHTTVLDDAFTYPESAGGGVTAYVMDTGIRTAHTEFEGRASVGFDAIGDGWNGEDCSTAGHGTHVAGTIGGRTYGVAKKVKLVSVRVLSCENSGTTSQIIAGIDWVTAHAQRPAVVNMSLGGGKSAVEDIALRNSIASGITYAVSAGNDQKDACENSPANVSEAITVGASNPVDERARDWKDDPRDPTKITGGSNFGSCLDLFAPGEAIKSAHNATDSATITLHGTSMASPHVTGAIALLLAETPSATPAEVSATLLSRATTDVLAANGLGAGSPNRLLYTGVPVTGVCTLANDTRQAIPDQGSVTSTVEFTACPGRVADTARVRVRAEHPFRGDLSVLLVAPNGTERVVKAANGEDTAVDLDQTFPLTGMSTMDANGVWKLVVRDNFGFDEGTFAGWTLTLAESVVAPATPAPPQVSSYDYPADGRVNGGVGILGTFTFKPGGTQAFNKYSYQLDGDAQPTEIVAGGEISVAITPKAAGRRTLTVRTSNGTTQSAPTTYEFVVAGAGDVVDGGTLTADGASVGTTIPADKVLRLRFDGVAGDKLGIGVTPYTVNAFSKLWVLDPAGRSFSVDKNSGSSYVYQGFGRAAVLPTLTITGTYQVFIDPDGAGTGNATVQLSRNSTATTDVVVQGTPFTVTRPGQFAEFTIDGKLNSWYDLGFTDWTTSTALMSVDVFDAKGGRVGNQQYLTAIDAGRFKTEAAGKYRVVIGYIFGEGSGSAKLWLSNEINAGDVTTVQTGRQLTLTRPGQHARMRFDGTQGQRLAVGYADISLTDGNRPKAFVVGPDGTTKSLDSHAGGAAVPVLTRTGSHDLLVNAGPSTGTLTSWLSEDLDLGVITVTGSQKSASLSRPGQQGRVKFDGVAGQRLSLGLTTFSAGFADHTVRLVKPDGAGVDLGGFNPAPGSIAFDVLPVSGVYEIVINSSNTNGVTGTVSLTLSTPVNAGTLTIGGSTVRVSVSRAGQDGQLSFTGATGDKLRLTTSGSTFTNKAFSLTVLNPDGTKLVDRKFQTDQGAFDLPVLPAAGTYVVLIDPSVAGTGSVNVGLARVP
ncbi:S8 family serine peptidase [Lentzea nigeriaca]|uniref:S8 family serine peptidase n=1 Tax=Lentzea nigeriaca TaxID=1128665 RepID=UPI00195E7A58|nr:S8 family serine peptidase [Lentzea nigeriaca]MBM7861006.1 subtilisin family serine protease [Lentzea nigeriaca]